MKKQQSQNSIPRVVSGAIQSGILLIDKPAGMTSHDVVHKVRKRIQQKQVGHAGTLDPSATGLLVLLLGEATKLSNYILSGDKAYEAKIHLGIKTNTGDKDGEIIEEKEVSVTEKQVLDAVKSLAGDFHWEVPIFSAVKKGGRRLHEMARNNEPVEPPKKWMNFKETRVIRTELPYVYVYLRCSKGGFVRTWAEKLGEALGTVSTVDNLRRVESEPYKVGDAISIEQVESRVEPGAHWVTIDQALPDWASFKVEGMDQKLILNGQVPHKINRFLEVEFLSRGHERVKIVSRQGGQLLTLLEYGPKGYKIQRVFNSLPHQQ